jgi:endonuclease/exonuclease/phosphatase family metal-dependent hydrolase
MSAPWRCAASSSAGVSTIGDSVPGGWKGTGFLVAPKLLLTNHHVLNSIDVAREATCQFNYLIGPDGKAEAWAEYRLVPEELFLTSPYDNGLDYTFVSIEPSAAAKFGTVELERAAYVIHPGTYANIIQHPDGRPQEIVLQDNEVVNDDGVFLHYVSDTDYGSSGSPVFDNAWKLIGLHHARKANDNKLKVGSGAPPEFLNEGIKIATIATDIEQRAQREGSSSYAATILKAFKGINSISGFFGTLGRASPPPNGTDSAEIVVDLYKGTETDIDVGFWNIEWFSNRFETKTKDVATIIADFNLDIWALAESSPAAAQELVDTLKQQFKLDYAVAHSEPNAGTGKQSTSVLWNTKTVSGKRVDWPAEIADWFTIDSRDFDDSMLEAVHGRVFDRYPGLFQFSVLNRKKSLDFYLVPLHLKAMDEGSLRRGMATKILAAAVNRMIEKGADRDWVIGGDFNAELGSGDFAPLDRKNFVPISAEDEGNGSITYIKGRFKSEIDHIYLSPNMARQYGPKDFYIVAADHSIPDYVSKISDHRPVLARLSLGRGEAAPRPTPLPKDLQRALRDLDQAKSGKSYKPAAAKSKAASAARRAVAQMQSRPPRRQSKPVARKTRARARKKK